jgi:hypothetical protein
MLMHSEESVQAVAKEFLSGNYSFDLTTRDQKDPDGKRGL